MSTESDLAAHVVAHLEGCGHDVYQEVECTGGVADIVALAGPAREVWVVETKTSWSLDLLVQCISRRRVAHRVFAAVPIGSGRVNHADLFVANGVGVLRVRDDHGYQAVGRTKVEVLAMAPRVSSDPKHARRLRREVCEGHKTHAKAGAASAGGRFTEFKATFEALQRFVLGKPGATMREAVDGIKHHYGAPATARSWLARYIERGIIDGIEIRYSGRTPCLFPKSPTKAAQ